MCNNRLPLIILLFSGRPYGVLCSSDSTSTPERVKYGIFNSYYSGVTPSRTPDEALGNELNDKAPEPEGSREKRREKRATR